MASIELNIFGYGYDTIDTHSYIHILDIIHTICAIWNPKSTLQRTCLNLLVHKQSSHSLPSPNTHTGHQNLLLSPSSLTQNRTDLARPRSTQRMTQGNRTPARVHLSMVQAEVVQTVHSHRGKGLVDLVDVDVALGQVELVEQFGDGGCWADTHHPWRDTGDSGAAEFGQDGLVELDGFGAAHEEDGGGCSFILVSGRYIIERKAEGKLTTISDLTGIPTSSPVPELRERRTNLTQRLRGSPIPNPLITSQSNLLDLPSLRILHRRLNRHDLIIKPPALLRLLSAPERLSRELVLRLARDVEVRTHVLRRLAHRLHAVGRFLVPENLLVEGLGDAVAVAGHQLGADGHADVDGAELDLVRDVLDGFQA